MGDETGIVMQKRQRESSSSAGFCTGVTQEPRVESARRGPIKSGAQVDLVTGEKVRRVLAVFKGRNEPRRHVSRRGEFAAPPIVQDYG